MKQLTVLTGAGISADSGLKTFRDSDGYWRSYRFDEVASPIAWKNNPQDVLTFYNERRRQLQQVEPNNAHLCLAKLEHYYKVQIITQNVDNLHERAGSTNILHLHGELTKARSSINPTLIYEIGYNDIEWGSNAEDGSPLRPHIVWFGEDVPLFARAIELIDSSDILLIIGTSLQVYPASTLINYCKKNIPIYYIDPKAQKVPGHSVTIVSKKAFEGINFIWDQLLKMR